MVLTGRLVKVDALPGAVLHTIQVGDAEWRYVALPVPDITDKAPSWP